MKGHYLNIDALNSKSISNCYTHVTADIVVFLYLQLKAEKLLMKGKVFQMIIFKVV